MDFLRFKASSLPFEYQSYTFQEIIGSGGYATVFLVQKNDTGIRYAAKVMYTGSEGAQKRIKNFNIEIDALKALNHPNIIRIYESFVESLYLIMILDLCPNGSLHTELVKKKRIPYNEFVYYAKNISEALKHCHAIGIAHLDLKTENILLDAHRRPKLADFGLSIIYRSRADDPHTYTGTLQYMAPEILNNERWLPFPADIWSLGILFATMLMGKTPWPSDSLGTIKKLIASGNYTLNKRVPPQVCELLDHMLVLDPSKRLNIAQVLQHPIFQDPIPKVLPSTRGALRRSLNCPPTRFGKQEHSLGDDCFDDEPKGQLYSALFIDFTALTRTKARYHSTSSYRAATFGE